MESRFQGLHPQKRLKIMLQQEKEQRLSQSSSSSLVPAKKRKHNNSSWDSSSTCYLPAKKRIRAPHPLIKSPNKTNLSFDLNVLYEPSPSPEKKPLHEDEEQQEKEEEQDDDDSDDDGIVCGVCRSTDGDPLDPIVLCDGCDAMVHATCYGDPLNQGVPEGDWFCASCQQSSSNSSTSCCLCPMKGGVMKPTVDERWAHIECALFVPEVFFRDPEGRGGIDYARVPSKRWEEICYICNSTKGCAIQCSEPKCSLAFHVSCGLNEELCVEYKEGRSGRGGAIVAGFCKSHSELWMKQQQTGKFKIVAREEHKQWK